MEIAQGVPVERYCDDFPLSLEYFTRILQLLFLDRVHARCGSLSARVIIGIEPLDLGAPEGIPRTSAVLIAGESGTGKSALIAHIAANFMLRGEKCLYVALDDSPDSFIEQLESFGWPGRELFSRGLLYIVDGYSYTTARHLESPYSSKRVNIQKIDEFIYAIISSIDELRLKDSGVLIIDSLNDFFYFHDITKIVVLIKSLRAYASKSRGVLSLFVLHTDTDELASFEKNIEHLFDGVVYTRINESLRSIGIPLKELLVKKLRGASTNPFWIPYAITSSGVRSVDIEKLMSLIKSKVELYERLGRVEGRG